MQSDFLLSDVDKEEKELECHLALISLALCYHIYLKENFGK